MSRIKTSVDAGTAKVSRAGLDVFRRDRNRRLEARVQYSGQVSDAG